MDIDELEHVPLKQLLKKKGKEKEMINSLRCQRFEIPKSRIKLGNNKKKRYSLAFFSFLAALSTLDGHT